MSKRKHETDDAEPRKQKQTLDVALQMVRDNNGALDGLTDSKKEMRQVLMLSMQLASPPRFTFPIKFVCDRKFISTYLLCGGQFGWTNDVGGRQIYYGQYDKDGFIARHFEDVEFVYDLLKRTPQYITDPDSIIKGILHQRYRYVAQWMDLIKKMLEYSQGGLVAYLIKMRYISRENEEAMIEKAIWIRPRNISVVHSTKWTVSMVADALTEGTFEMTGCIMHKVIRNLHRIKDRFEYVQYVRVIADFLGMQDYSWVFDFYQLGRSMEFKDGFKMGINEFISYYVRHFCKTNRYVRVHALICNESICEDHGNEFIQRQIRDDPLIFLCNSDHWKDRILWFCAVAPMIHLVTSTCHQRQVQMEDVGFSFE